MEKCRKLIKKEKGKDELPVRGGGGGDGVRQEEQEGGEEDEIACGIVALCVLDRRKKVEKNRIDTKPLRHIYNCFIWANQSVKKRKT